MVVTTESNSRDAPIARAKAVPISYGKVCVVANQSSSHSSLTHSSPSRMVGITSNRRCCANSAALPASSVITPEFLCTNMTASSDDNPCYAHSSAQSRLHRSQQKFTAAAMDGDEGDPIGLWAGILMESPVDRRPCGSGRLTPARTYRGPHRQNSLLERSLAWSLLCPHRENHRSSG